MSVSIEINGRRIGPGHPVYLIAEMSGNHNQSFDEAVRIVEAAKAAGADAVKLQTYTPDTITMDGDHPAFKVPDGTLWTGKTLYQLYGEAYTPWEWQPKLKEIANGLGMDLFSSPFDFTAVDFLEKMNVPAYKVASFEMCDVPLVEYMARTGKPMIMSTGMSSVAEIQEAVDTARGAGCTQLVLLKCTSAYPAPPEEMNIRAIPFMAERFGTAVGLSDHTLTNDTAIASVALGACVIEKHFTLSRSAPGPDNAFSLEPHEFRALVDSVRTVEKALGDARFVPTAHEAGNLQFRRSLFVTEDVRAGEALTAKNVRSIRPGVGLAPRHYREVLGRKAARDIRRGTPLAWDLVS
jgi:N-acetylneuraminate synthase